MNAEVARYAADNLRVLRDLRPVLEWAAQQEGAPEPVSAHAAEALQAIELAESFGAWLEETPKPPSRPKLRVVK